jgi:hypothetical protein
MTKKKHEPTGDYDVGYCRPPEATQFKKGDKPPGRRGEDGDREVDIADLLDGPVPVTVRGRRTHKAAFELSLTALVKEGLKGKVGAIKQALDEFEKFGLLKRVPRKVLSPWQIVSDEVPHRMAEIVLGLYGRSPWSSEQMTHARKLYLDSRTPEEAKEDEFNQYGYLLEEICPPH